MREPAQIIGRASSEDRKLETILYAADAAIAYTRTFAALDFKVGKNSRLVPMRPRTPGLGVTNYGYIIIYIF
jgi:hypothetical protein